MNPPDVDPSGEWEPGISDSPLADGPGAAPDGTAPDGAGRDVLVSSIAPGLYGADVGAAPAGPSVGRVGGPAVGPLVGAVSGLLAVFTGLGVAELATGLVRGAPSPVAAVGDAVIDAAPPALRDWGIATFGTANKPVLVVTTVVLLALAGALLGLLAVRGRPGLAVTLAALAAVPGAVAVVTRPTTSVAHVVPTVLGTATTIGVLWWAWRSWRPDRIDRFDGHHGAGYGTGGPAPVPMGVDRRHFLGGSALLGIGGATAGGLGRLLQRRFEIAAERSALVVPGPDRPATLPDDVELDVEGVTPFVTPNDDFFRIDTALTVPQVSVEEWRLRVHGMVEREIVIDFDDLLRREQVERYVTIACVSNEVGGGLIGNARWQGVLLADVLREAGVDPAAEQLVSRSFDGWSCGTPVSAVLDGRDALLAHTMNGEPLPSQHGYPVRMVVPGLFGYVSATKWVTEMELTTWLAYDAYWVRRRWAEQAPVKTMTRIDRPRRGSTWPAGPVDVAGMAWAVHRGISAVEVRIDEGPWERCELAGVPSDDTWRQWRYRWDATPGDHVVEARAVDGEGVPQPAEPRPPAPDGAQGYHRVAFRVT